jgi:cytidylate kinase
MSPPQPGEKPPRPFVVAIDGPAASGKGTLARRLSERFGLAHLDTGKLYRATAFLALEAGADPADPAAALAAARRVDPAILADKRLLAEDVAGAASVVAAIPEVRAALLAFQRDFAAHPPHPAGEGAVPGGAPRGAILDGRDIGTIVCPDAAVKLFITASPQARAERRVRELRERGVAVIYGGVLQDMKERDARDSLRRVAPLAAAPDADTIDTTLLDADQVFEQASEIIARALSAQGQKAGGG